MDVIIIGVLASVFTGISLLPQLIKIIRSKKAEDVSYLMFMILFAGCILWIVYGIMKEDWIIIVSNFVSVIINVVSTYFSIKYHSKNNKQ